MVRAIRAVERKPPKPREEVPPELRDQLRPSDVVQYRYPDRETARSFGHIFEKLQAAVAAKGRQSKGQAKADRRQAYSPALFQASGG